jgi:hypothetical protein
MGTNVSSSSVGFSLSSVGGTWSWTVRSNNVYGGSQLYQVDEILTPWGRLSDVESPIPADVVEAMAASISDLRGQLAPLLSLVQGVSSFNVTVTEGDSVSSAASVLVQNSGAFGSFMTATGTPSAPWLSVDPSSLSGVPRGGQGTFNVRVIPSTLLSNSSPYVGTVNLQDNRTPSTVIPLTFVVTVLPKPAISLSVTDVTFTFSLSTMTSGMSTGTVTVTNAGPPNSLLNFTVGKLNNCSPWLVVSPTSGGPLAVGGSSDLSLSLTTANVPGIPGVYTETVQVSSTTASNSPKTFTVQLVVTA